MNVLLGRVRKAAVGAYGGKKVNNTFSDVCYVMHKVLSIIWCTVHVLYRVLMVPD